ncbi:MAG: helix-turn-helix domain-containing protein, partial [Moorea sp. SIO1G6]|uniref:helix-turn-helix domain-containing protein n=1 Tax=Moorena sp. SIO1G6 TaxID=2607840 RepID=UPI0013C1393E|nr:helix-turn-helix domain-containing protein [Moorena sp. SIO1G6]
PMSRQPILELDEVSRITLEAMRDNHPKAYMRERAAALLKMAAGKSGAEVARSGLLKERQADTVYGWRSNYEQEGLGGLYLKPGRGRKPAFSPSE